ncbi:MAG TPA: hypothetical protein VI653_11425 [Steroidobacteraceae bacterium]
MKRIACFAAMAVLGASCDALSMGGIAEVTVIDRDDGVRLPLHYYHGEYWVAGRPGAKYAIEIRNRMGERLLVVTSVDGVNVISGDTASWSQSGYVLDGGEHYRITGWRKSNSEVAAFTFTASPSSYAARTGRPENIGVIGVALFREKQRQIAYVAPEVSPAPLPLVEDEPGAAPSASEARSAPTATPAPPPAAPAPADSALSRNDAAGSARSSSERQVAEAIIRPKLGTGHGTRESSFVVNVDFERLQPQPNEVIRIRYDSLDNLVAMGIIERPPSIAPLADPFPGSPEPGYVPDP